MFRNIRRFYQWLFVGKRNKNLEYCHDLCSRMAWQYDSKKFQQESDVICIPFAVPYIFQRDRASAGEPQPDACGHEQSNHKREVSNSRKNCSTRSNPIIDITKFLYIVFHCKNIYCKIHDSNILVYLYITVRIIIFHTRIREFCVF